MLDAMREVFVKSNQLLVTSAGAEGSYQEHSYFVAGEYLAVTHSFPLNFFQTLPRFQSLPTKTTLQRSLK